MKEEEFARERSVATTTTAFIVSVAKYFISDALFMFTRDLILSIDEPNKHTCTNNAQLRIFKLHIFLWIV